jgi:hypothetical protein
MAIPHLRHAHAKNSHQQELLEEDAAALDDHSQACTIQKSCDKVTDEPGASHVMWRKGNFS